MAATSVTGRGQGVATNQKGPGNNRNFFVPQINPHVVAAGTVAMAAGTEEVYFPNDLPNAAANYAVIVTGRTNDDAYVSAKTDVSSAFSSFTITATQQTVDWVVVSVGYGLDVTA